MLFNKDAFCLLVFLQYLAPMMSNFCLDCQWDADQGFESINDYSKGKLLLTHRFSNL